MIVLDASALLAYLFREKGHDVVAEHLAHCCMSTVNLCEVAGRFVRDGVDASLILQSIEQTSIHIIPFSVHHALCAAKLIPQTQGLGLSLGDRACLGLAQEKHLPVLTADSAWSSLAGVKVVQIR